MNKLKQEVRFLTDDWKKGGLAIFMTDLSAMQSIDWIECGVLFCIDAPNKEKWYYRIKSSMIDRELNIIFKIEKEAR